MIQQGSHPIEVFEPLGHAAGPTADGFRAAFAGLQTIVITTY